ncbi:FecR domain-containing protein [Sphingobium sp.]|uniref:FecR family protein n=1 Tax=Sphingobium sp. TaxID=1912891 RepID=UPI00257A2742|nr:FecR domain-containing protein [Sphingobium sp.]
MKARAEEAALWCIRMVDGPLDAEGRAAFDAWLAQDAANQAAFDQMAELWEDLDQQAEAPEVLLHRAKALDWLRWLNRRRWSRAPDRRWPWWWLVPVAAMFVLSAYATLHIFAARPLATGVGERQVATLEDGSKVSLDAASKVDIAFDDAHRNLTLLSGRAKFDVAKDRARPFSVIAGDKQIVATGTSFSVELLHGRTRVILYEGHVAILSRDSDGVARPVRLSGSRLDAGSALKPGDLLIAFAGSDASRIEPTDVDRSLSWEMGLLDFRNELLIDAADRLNRYSDRKLVIDDDATANLRIDGVFHGGDIKAFVDNIASLYPVTVVHEADAVHLRRKPAV